MANILQHTMKNSVVSLKRCHNSWWHSSISKLTLTVLIVAALGSPGTAAPKETLVKSNLIKPKTVAPSKTLLFKPRAASGPFDIALMGDLGYTPTEEAKFQNIITDVNSKNIAFSIHDGDFKSGASPCTDTVFQQRLGWFQQFRSPFIFTPGDNEWTDCHRVGANPLERLTKLRDLFFSTSSSLGQSVLSLDRQSVSGQASSVLYRENARWVYGEVGFVTLHIVGSNNNLGRTPEADQEYQARNIANLEWLRSSFALAKTYNLAGLMIVIQANPGFELPRTQRTGFNDFLDALQQEVSLFPKPVVLVHGDTHRFQINKPLFNPSGQLLLNFTRVETFGSPNAHWVKARVDSLSSNVFTFEPMTVAANR